MRDWVHAAVLELEESLAEAVRRGQEAGETAPGVDAAGTGHVLLVVYLGLYVVVRTGAATEPVLRAVVRQVEAMPPAPVALSE